MVDRRVPRNIFGIDIRPGRTEQLDSLKVVHAAGKTLLHLEMVRVLGAADARQKGRKAKSSFATLQQPLPHV